jgi:rubrerythrin
MRDSTRLGTNRTGLKTSPLQSKRLLETVSGESVMSDGEALDEVRLNYIEEAEPVGSVPPPATIKGVAKAGMTRFKGERPQVLIDKLAERLAFERGGTRLYDALLSKARAHGDELGNVSVDAFERIRNQEAAHFQLLQECLENLGADPTAQTPSADLVGVETLGLLQAITDPRTTMADSLHAAMIAELTDGAGWEVLIALADGFGHEDMVTRFREALQHEAEHLATVRSCYESLILGESRTRKS